MNALISKLERSSCLLTVILTASQYVAILLPGEIFRDSYKEADVAPYVLSRTLEDGGTIFSYLIPWSAAAIYVSSTLGVTTLDYLPYAFLPILCPIFAIIYAATGFALFKTCLLYTSLVTRTPDSL